MTNRFAAFVITYRRTEELSVTIKQIFGQDVVPSKLLIIDNDVLGGSIAEQFSKDGYPVTYHQMGYNSGPAGASKYALRELTEEGYDFIYWGDDNNGPLFPDTFSRLIHIFKENSKAGIVGAVGHFFNSHLGIITRMPDTKVYDVSSTPIPADCVAGGMSMLVRSEVVIKNGLPDERYFFGLEELDFCLTVKSKGFSILIDPDLYRRCRTLSGKRNYERPIYIRKSEIGLQREYYSLRNILLLSIKNKLVIAFLFNHLRWFIKIFIGFKYGWRYGWKNFSIIFLAFRDFYFGNFGLRVPLR